MRVISTRQNIDNWSYEVTCSDCESKLEVSAGDLKRVDDPRDGNYAVCKCPVCERNITLDHVLIPRALWVRLKG